jgi:anti-sigma regulatory factor (Ser/Thr protein kinase)
MSDALWGRRAVPVPGDGAVPIGRWAPRSLADLSTQRRQLAAAVRHDDRRWAASVVAEGAQERLLLCVEELASNALRHGRPPVQVTLTADDRFWLLVVSDGAGDVPPSPAADRDAAEGGLGLYLVARISGAHGWVEHGDGKATWVRIDYTLTEAPSEIVDSVPRPSLRTTRRGLARD